MNKKFSTLMALALLAGSFSANAQVVGDKYGVSHSLNGPVNGETAFRTQLTTADAFDRESADLTKFNYNDYRVNKIEAGKWYQLEVTTPTFDGSSEQYVLAQVRNYETGELSLKVVKQSQLTSISGTPTTDRMTGNPSLNSSLWRIDVTTTTDGSDIYKFTNKETGFTLSYNCAEATKITAKSELTNNSELSGVTANAGSEINKSDIAEWRWYTKAKTSDPDGFGAMKLYVYNHDRNQIIGLAQDGDNVVSVIADAALAGGSTGTQIATDYNILSLTVRNAGVRVLSAADINSMIDADGSWMNKAHYAERDSAFFKNGLTDKDGKEIKINNDLFKAGYKAHEVKYQGLQINKDLGQTTSPYAGYYIYLAKQYADVNGTLYNKYLTVMPNDRYENAPSTGNHRGLVVKDEFFGFVKNAGTANAEIEYNGLIDNAGKYVGNYDGNDRDGAFTNKDLTTGVDAFTARYLWKVSYYPTVDSLVFEPLNASIVGTQDINDGNKWEQTALATAPAKYYYNSVNKGVAAAHVGTPDDTNINNGVDKDANIPVALTVMNMGGSYDDGNVLTVGTSIKNYGATFIGKQLNDKLGKPVVTNFESTHGLKAQFDHEYTHMTRATVEDGLYYIQISVNKNDNNSMRTNGKYLVMNMAGRLLYDSPTEYQNYDHMPATQWVIEKDTCALTEGSTPYVYITNREYGKASAAKSGLAENYSFYGQLYKTTDNKYYFINHSDAYNRKADNQGKFTPAADNHYYFSCGDTLLITPVMDETAKTDAYVGYKKFDETALPYETWAIKYSTADFIGGMQNDRYLQINDKGYLVVEDEMAKDFEVMTGYDEKGNVLEDNFGYAGKWGGKYTQLPQLKRQAYVLKVRDNNLIDNNWNYLTAKNDATNNIFFQSSHLKYVDGENVQMGVFYFKADQITKDAEDAYVPVQMIDWTKMSDYDANNNGWSGWDAGNNPAANNVYEIANNVNSHEIAGYNGRKFYENGYMQMGVTEEAKTNHHSLDVNPETRNDAFVFVNDPRPLYMPIGTDVTNGKMNSTIEFFRTRGAAVENLFEDGHNQSVNKGETRPVTEVSSFLGMTAEGIKPVGKNVNTEFYADSVVSSNPRMPQYLFFVDNDSIKDGRWCVTNQHGYFESKDEADKLDKTHHTFYNGYVAGRVLVNLNDSVFKYANDIDKMDMAAKFAYANMTRLGFVEGIHAVIDEDAYNAEGSAAWKGYVYNETLKKEEFVKLPKGEYLLVLHKDIKLADLLTEVGDRKDVIDPVKLNKAMEAKQIDWNVLNGKHQNYAFSLRYTDDDHIDVLLESKGRKDAESYYEGTIGTFNEASWLRIENGVPVLAQPYNFNGNHTQIGSSSSMQDLFANQAQILNVNKGQTQEATANETIAAGNVVVAGVDGAVVVKGAEGKNVIVSTILGKVVANEVVSSDNAQISAPAGIVVVSVDGESFKVVVK